jgi:hypothetical protein
MLQFAHGFWFRGEGLVIAYGIETGVKIFLSEVIPYKNHHGHDLHVPDWWLEYDNEVFELYQDVCKKGPEVVCDASSRIVSTEKPEVRVSVKEVCDDREQKLFAAIVSIYQKLLRHVPERRNAPLSERSDLKDDCAVIRSILAARNRCYVNLNPRRWGIILALIAGLGIEYIILVTEFLAQYNWMCKSAGEDNGFLMVQHTELALTLFCNRKIHNQHLIYVWCAFLSRKNFTIDELKDFSNILLLHAIQLGNVRFCSFMFYSLRECFDYKSLLRIHTKLHHNALEHEKYSALLQLLYKVPNVDDCIIAVITAIFETSNEIQFMKKIVAPQVVGHIVVSTDKLFVQHESIQKFALVVYSLLLLNKVISQSKDCSEITIAPKWLQFFSAKPARDAPDPKRVSKIERELERIEKRTAPRAHLSIIQSYLNIALQFLTSESVAHHEVRKYCAELVHWSRDIYQFTGHYCELREAVLFFAQELDQYFGQETQETEERHKKTSCFCCGC